MITRISFESIFSPAGMQVATEIWWQKKYMCFAECNNITPSLLLQIWQSCFVYAVLWLLMLMAENGTRKEANELYQLCANTLYGTDIYASPIPIQWVYAPESNM